MGVIDETLFKNSITSLMNEISQCKEEIEGKVKQTIDQSKIDFADVEKLLVSRCIKVLNEEIKKFKEKNITYDSLKGVYHKAISFYVEDWEEYKAYQNCFEGLYGYVYEKELNEALRNTFSKYGLPNDGVYYDTYHHEPIFEYTVFTVKPHIQSQIAK